MDKLLMLGDFNNPEIDGIYEAAREVTFGYQLLEFVHTRRAVQRIDQATRWRFVG